MAVCGQPKIQIDIVKPRAIAVANNKRKSKIPNLICIMPFDT